MWDKEFLHTSDIWYWSYCHDVAEGDIIWCYFLLTFCFSVSDESGKVQLTPVKTGKIERSDLGSDVSEKKNFPTTVWPYSLMKSASLLFVIWPDMWQACVTLHIMFERYMCSLLGMSEKHTQTAQLNRIIERKRFCVFSHKQNPVWCKWVVRL